MSRSQIELNQVVVHNQFHKLLQDAFTPIGAEMRADLISRSSDGKLKGPLAGEKRRRAEIITVTHKRHLTISRLCCADALAGQGP